MEEAYLILADGTVFAGTPVGARGSVIGETVFTTGMTGYLETLTDPSYFGQIVTQTFPLVGNYGVIPEDFESETSWVRGYVVREVCDHPSNFRCAGSLHDFLAGRHIVGIAGIDTRRLTKLLREAGVMNGMIASGSDAESVAARLASPAEKENLLAKIRAYTITDAVQSVQTVRAVPQAVAHDGTKKRVVLVDFGAKKNIRRELEKRGLSVIVVPCNATAAAIQALDPDGIMLSNGPGDPAANGGIIAEIRKLCETGIPLFGICLGHQMLALARGARTGKLTYGHRGANQPVKDRRTGRVLITSQNHGYAVENDSLPPCATLRFVNMNDGTCEGIEYTDIPAFSVQFHPEACGGPHDTNYLFDTFLEMIRCHYSKTFTAL